MKTYDEMAQSVFQRSEIIKKQQKKKRNIVLAAVSGLFICSLAIVGVWAVAKPAGPLGYGTVTYLSAADKGNPSATGNAFAYIQGTAPPVRGPSQSPPDFRFPAGAITVVAKAMEEMVGEYKSLNEYGSTEIDRYRLFRMEILDPLQSGMEGEFYYLLPAKLKGDLTQYDALLIGMSQLPPNYVLRSADELFAFEYLFMDWTGLPELGSIIAFTDGIFDESLWQDKSWGYGYQFAKSRLDNDESLSVYARLIVSRGSTLEEALQRLEKQRVDWGYTSPPKQINHYKSQTELAQQTMEYIKPFGNGVFVPQLYIPRPKYDYYYRYINGCPTNEWICIYHDDGNIEASEYRFEDADFEGLPNISDYIASLELSQIAPQHTDPVGKILAYKSAVGWYEKTQNGVYSIVRIAWRYYEHVEEFNGVKGVRGIEYYDETFILLDETGDHLISRDELIELIGNNRNISYEEYGIGVEMPWE